MYRLSKFSQDHLILGQVLVTLLSIILGVLMVAAGVLMSQDATLSWESGLWVGFVGFVLTHVVYHYVPRVVRVRRKYVFQRYLMGAMYGCFVVLSLALGIKTGQYLNQDPKSTQAHPTSTYAQFASQVSPEAQLETQRLGFWERFKYRLADRFRFLKRLENVGMGWRIAVYVLIFAASIAAVYFLVALGCVLLCSEMAALGIFALFVGPILAVFGSAFSLSGLFRIEKRPNRGWAYFLDVIGKIISIPLASVIFSFSSVALGSWVLALLAVLGIISGLVYFGVRNSSLRSGE